MKSRAQKREEAEARNAEHRALSLEERIEKANNAPGNCTRQKNRLLKEVKKR